MGACTPSHGQESTHPICGFYGEVLKCPAKHWLAFYETPECSLCKSRSITSVAHISCTQCDYSLCKRCFERRFRKWERIVQHLPADQALKLNNSLNEQLRKIMEICVTEIESRRLKKYLAQQSTKYSGIRAEENPNSLVKSIGVRVDTLARLCKTAYDSRCRISA